MRVVITLDLLGNSSIVTVEIRLVPLSWRGPIHTQYSAISARAQLGLLANLANQRINRLVKEQIKPLRLTQLQYHILFMLKETDTWMRQQDLNQILHTPKRKLRLALIDLADRNMVDRVVPVGTCKLCDRPACYACTEIRINEFGEGILEAANVLVDAVYRSLGSGLVPSEYQSGLIFLRELSGLNTEARLVSRHRVLTLTPRSVPTSKIRPAG